MRVLSFLQRLYEAWMALSRMIGLVMSRIILTLLWLTGIALYALIMKTARLLRPVHGSATGWKDVPVQDAPSMRHQF